MGQTSNTCDVFFSPAKTEAKGHHRCSFEITVTFQEKFVNISAIYLYYWPFFLLSQFPQNNCNSSTGPYTKHAFMLEGERSRHNDLSLKQVAQGATIGHLSRMCQQPLISNKPASSH